MRYRKKSVSTVFNMSLGLIPAIVCMIAIRFTSGEYALGASAILGWIYAISLFYLSGKKVYNFILYTTTLILSVLFLLKLLPGDILPGLSIIFTTEIMVVLSTYLVVRSPGLLRKIFNRNGCDRCNDLIGKSLESAIISSRILFLMGLLHFLTITLFMLFEYPLVQSVKLVLFIILPPVLFTACIGINQLGIYYANRLIDTGEEIPIVNEEGNVIGKRFKTEASTYKNSFLNPVIRIAFIHDGKLFLCKRKDSCLIDKNKTDIPLETYLQFGESLDDGLKRLLAEVYPEDGLVTPRFSVKHHFKNANTNRLIYLYITYITNEELLCNPHFPDGKLWTFAQIEQNLQKSYFSALFENEYDHLKTSVSIWEDFLK